MINNLFVGTSWPPSPHICISLLDNSRHCPLQIKSKVNWSIHKLTPRSLSLTSNSIFDCFLPSKLSHGHWWHQPQLKLVLFSASGFGIPVEDGFFFFCFDKKKSKVHTVAQLHSCLPSFFWNNIREQRMKKKKETPDRLIRSKFRPGCKP